MKGKDEEIEGIYQKEMEGIQIRRNYTRRQANVDERTTVDVCGETMTSQLQDDQKVVPTAKNESRILGSESHVRYIKSL